ncbi:hypothetical protein ACIQVK_53240 [Streptomyces sp. NPDC090493]|uniref:hypothetical protein n=1 Tax=Streptomyces sp. NPDC090493 TaxID=3365964 RepID=UPI003827EA6B
MTDTTNSGRGGRTGGAGEPDAVVDAAVDSVGDAVVDAWRYPLFPALARRRSRRFPVGAASNGLSPFTSTALPQPLTHAEEALLVMAANGATGPVLPDDLLGGTLDHTMAFHGRTYPSACAVHGTTLLLTNDEGVFVAGPVPLTDQPPQDAADAYLRCRTRIADGRLDIPMDPPATARSNAWSVNKPGTTLLMPVTDVTHQYINMLMMMLDAPNRTYVYDDLNGGAEPLAKYAGRLDRARGLPLSAFELKLAQSTAATEQALMLGNAFLATQALGLGGWLFAPSDPVAVLATLGFDPGLAPHVTPCRPPYRPTMADAVRRVVAEKHHNYAAADTPLRRNLVTGATPVSDWCVDAVVDLCTYVWETYGRFPARIPPVQMVSWFQTHHLDTAYYDRYYRPGTYHDDIRTHHSRWHTGRTAN